MPISDFGDLQRSLAAVLDDAQDAADWNRAVARAGGIPSFFRPWDLSGAGAEPTDKVRRLIRALQEGEVRVEADGDHTLGHKRVILPEGFWRGGYVLWTTAPDRDAWSLQALSINKLAPAPACFNPRFVAQQAGAPMQLAWQIAEEILGTPEAPPGGYGRLISLARLVRPRLKTAGLDLEDETIASYLRKSLREWEEKHPGC